MVKRCAFYGFVVVCFYRMVVKCCFVASSSKRLNLLDKHLVVARLLADVFSVSFLVFSFV